MEKAGKGKVGLEISEFGELDGFCILCFVFVRGDPWKGLFSFDFLTNSVKDSLLGTFNLNRFRLNRALSLLFSCPLSPTHLLSPTHPLSYFHPLAVMSYHQ